MRTASDNGKALAGKLPRDVTGRLKLVVEVSRKCPTIGGDTADYRTGTEGSNSAHSEKIADCDEPGGWLFRANGGAGAEFRRAHNTTLRVVISSPLRT